MKAITKHLRLPFVDFSSFFFFSFVLFSRVVISLSCTTTTVPSLWSNDDIASISTQIIYNSQLESVSYQISNRLNSDTCANFPSADRREKKRQTFAKRLLMVDNNFRLVGAWLVPFFAFSATPNGTINYYPNSNEDYYQKNYLCSSNSSSSSNELFYQIIYV